jgi:SAM-dependent methyltransferase
MGREHGGARDVKAGPGESGRAAEALVGNPEMPSAARPPGRPADLSGKHQNFEHERGQSAGSNLGRYEKGLIIPSRSARLAFTFCKPRHIRSGTLASDPLLMSVASTVDKAEFIICRGMRSLFQRCWRRASLPLRLTEQGELKKFRSYVRYFEGKSGLEIGGPSEVFRKGNAVPVYEAIKSLDNCDFSRTTVWAEHQQDFLFHPDKPAGRTHFCEGSALVQVADSTYDFVLSSHNLEHFANPVKALKEWLRVMKPGGALVLALPYYRDIFDHRRKPTSVQHMWDDFAKNTEEDDLTHLPEILEKHDLTMDAGAGSREQFHKRSLDNISNRCLHHHVFDERNSRALLSSIGFQVLSVDLVVPPHILVMARLRAT